MFGAFYVFKSISSFKYYIHVLTNKNTAPTITAFILMSRSTGKEIPKLSASVNSSLPNPVHCFVTLPTNVVSSAVCTYKTFCKVFCKEFHSIQCLNTWCKCFIIVLKFYQKQIYVFNILTIKKSFMNYPWRIDVSDIEIINLV